MLRDRFRTILDRVFQSCGLIACAGFGVLTLVVLTDIAFRNLGIGKWPWLGEVTEYLLTLSTFFGAPWLLRQRGHVNVDIVLRLVRRPVAQAMTRVADILGLLICALLFYVALRVVVDSHAVGALVFKNLIFPEWYLHVPMTLCFGLCTLEFLSRLIGGQRGMA